MLPSARATQLTLSANDLHFGNVVVGQARTLSATVTNTGEKSVKISSLRSGAKMFVVPKLKLPLTLEPGQHLVLHVGFHPVELGHVNGRILFNETEASFGVHGWGIKKPEPASELKANPARITFENVEMGKSAHLPITLTNTGTSSITISGRELKGAGFTIAGLGSSLTLEARHSLKFTIEFTPPRAGTVSGELTIAEREHPALVIPLRGTGTAAGRLSDVPATMNFGNVTVGKTGSRSGTLTAEEASVKVDSVTSSSAEFVVTGLSLPVTIAAGHSVHYTVTFTPRQSGAASAVLWFAGSAKDARLSLRVHGSGVKKSEPPQLVLKATPPSLTFGNVQTGDSAKLPIALTNIGASSVTISDQELKGAGFTVTGLSSPLTLEAGQSFTFAIEFTPEASGSVSGELTFSDRVHAPLVIQLRGTGTSEGQLNDAPAAMNFGNVTVGKSASRTGALSATEGSVKVKSVTSSSSEFVVTGLSLPVTIAAGHSVHYTVTFTPQQSGKASASLSFASNASDSEVSESVAGSGVAPKQVVMLSWNASTSQVVGYNIYRGHSGGGPYTRINSATDAATTFSDTSVAAGNTYFYVITAVNSKGQESKYSNQAEVVVPSQ